MIQPKEKQPIPQPVIETHSLSRLYLTGSIKVQALQDVNIKVDQGEFVALMGSSGSGKSTLLHLLGCLDTPTKGSYLLEGQDVGLLSKDQRAAVRNRRIGFIFQTFNLISRVPALDNVVLPLLYRGRQRLAWERARSALEKVGLGKRMHHQPSELSGGEQQRVAIARAIVTEPVILLADEPTGNLDSRTGKDILSLLTQLNQEGRTILMVTHDANIAAFAHRTLTMQDGQIHNGNNGR